MNNKVIFGPLSSEYIKIVGVDGTDYIADVNIKLGKQIYTGQVRMIYAENYDIAVFSLIREMFEIPFPEVGIINYMGLDYIVVKRFISRQLKESDYNSKIPGNKNFRYMLAYLIYLCRLIGCPFDLRNIEVVNDGIQDIPVIWRITSLGLSNPSTITGMEFLKIFNVSKQQLKDGYGNAMAISLIRRFKNIDFDTDVLRGYLYLREDELRWAKGQRVKYKLSKRPRQIENTIEKNYSLLRCKFPFKIFK